MADHTVWLESQAGRLDELAKLPSELFDRLTVGRALCVAAANDHADTVRFLLRGGAAASSGAASLAQVQERGESAGQRLVGIGYFGDLSDVVGLGHVGALLEMLNIISLSITK